MCNVRQIQLAPPDVFTPNEYDASVAIFKSLPSGRGSLCDKSRYLVKARPSPSLGKLQKIDNIRRGRFFVFAFAIPFLAALFKDALQELCAGFVAAIFFAGE